MNKRNLVLLTSVIVASALAINRPAAAQQGVTKNEIVIGSTLGLTSGNTALAAQGYKAALDSAVEELNEKGGIRGRKIKLITLDDGFEIQRSVANFRRLIDSEKVFAIVVPTGSPNIPASWPLVKSKGIPVFAPQLPPDPKLPSVFILGTSHFNQARTIVDFLVSKGVKSAVVFKQDTDLGKAIEDGVKYQAAGTSITLLPPITLELKATDVSSAVLSAREANPEAVIFATDPTQSSLLIQGMGKIGWAPLIIGNSTTVLTGSTATVGPAGQAAVGTYGTVIVEPVNSNAKGTQAWRNAVAKYQPAFNKPEYLTGQTAYASIQVFFEIIRRMEDDLTWANFQRVAESLSDFETNSLPPVTFSKDIEAGGHVGTKGVIVQQWNGSKWESKHEGFVQPQAK